MAKIKTEDALNLINGTLFLKEFTFKKTEFNFGDAGKSLELADGVVWLDDIILIFQVKERNSNKDLSEQDELKWFNNKVRKKAVSQIKSTLNYLKHAPKINLTNEAGHKVNFKELNVENIKALIVYNPDDAFPEILRFIKFYISESVSKIHLFHFEDYMWVTKYLITPAEIEDYLSFREKLYDYFGDYIDHFPEQLLLGHYLGGEDVPNFGPYQILNLQNFNEDIREFDIIGILSDFADHQIPIDGLGKTDHYYVIREIAKLKRNELREFKKRFIWAFNSCKTDSYDLPTRVTFPRTNIGFIFVPINRNVRKYWQNYLLNFTNLHKYEQRLNRCIGVAIFESSQGNNEIDIMWSSLEREWAYDEILENLLRERNPLRPVNVVNLEMYKRTKTNNP